MEKELTNEEIDAEIARLQSLKKIDEVTADGKPLRYHTRYYLVRNNLVQSVQFEGTEKVGYYSLEKAGYEFYYKELFSDPDLAIADNVLYHQNKVKKAKIGLERAEKELEIAQGLYKTEVIDYTF